MRLPTPGPWYVESGTPSGRRLVADLVEGDLRLIHYRIVHEGEVEGDGEADARLIAAAPELLEALRNLVGLARIAGPSLRQYEAAIGDAGAAIARTEGR